ncbi:MAG: transglycosylase SLT domain-containing protein, partial [Treponema sp.]|nr:transglycosylase SLT domain-containing protein [Treponema sp.]
ESLILTRAVIENPLTQQYIRQYSSPDGLKWLSAVMERGGPYLAFIRKEIAERKLPEELIYLPVIESGYLATALSRSGAAGFWQFMKNSITPFDMEVNDWLDERLDFRKSTIGALRKLEENYNYYNDWPLALAAYNAGLGALNRVIRESGIKDYWLLSERKLLKTETIHYYPKFAAVSYILSNHKMFGLEPQWPEDPLWMPVKVDRPADLRVLAEEAGLDAGELIAGNRELLYNITPPGKNYFLKVPARDAEKITALLEREDIALMRYYFHTIRSGDTLFALALHYGVKVEDILNSNPGIEERYLRLGSRLVIPALKEIGPYMRPPSAETLVFNGSHLVKKGETLWSIALGYNVDPEVLAEANGMELSGILREGITLKTPIK